jgi:RimJ/RimL family protein N-acetyltransferase
MKFSVTIPTLATDRIVLRALREDDVPALAKLHADAEVVRYLGSGQPEPSLGKAWDYVVLHTGHWAMKGCGKWALVDAKTDELFGRVGYIDSSYDWPGLELGWTIARERWGKGYAREAASLALDWGFTNLPRGEIISVIHPDNERSIQLAERLGERLARTWTAPSGVALHVYAITRDQWHARKAGQPGPRP